MKRINESEYGDMHLDYDMRRFAGYDKWKKKQDEIEQLKQDAKVDKNTAWKVADGRLKHKQDNLNMAFDDRKKHQQDWIDNGKKGVKQGLKNGEFKYHGKKHKWPSNNPVPFQRSDDEKEVLAKFDKEPFFNNETNESKNSMKKNIVKLNENTLRQIVAESVKKVLKENQYMSYEDTDAYREEQEEIRQENRRQNALKSACDELISVFYNYSATDEDCEYFLKYIGERIKIHDSSLGINGAD